MKIAIVGSGISGLTCAYHLSETHDVTVFEAAGYVGGHTNTIQVARGNKNFSIDTGFIVFNDRTYPNFIRLLDELGVDSQPTTMSFSVRNDQKNLEYRGADLNGFFAQRKNLWRPRFYQMLRDMLKFNKIARQYLDANNTDDETVEHFFGSRSFSREFIEDYFLPMGAAIWSCPTGTLKSFPIRFIMEFYANHGLLSVNDRPQWRVVSGGSNSYIPPLVSRFADRIRLNTPVLSVERSESGVQVITPDDSQFFDHVIFACHSDQALKILGRHATNLENEFLLAFPYEKNIAILHTDQSVMPRNQRAWACWNYWVDPLDLEKAMVTYNMNMLQGIEHDETFFVSLNCESRIEPSHVIRSIEYHHPIFSTKRKSIQAQHDRLIDHRNISYCGAYWGNGFHEDGVVSGLRVIEKIKEKTSNRKTSPELISVK